MSEDGFNYIDFCVGNLTISVRAVAPAWEFKKISDLLLKIISCAVQYLKLDDRDTKAFVDVLLADDNTIKKLNKIYRNNDNPTNVLSFGGQGGKNAPEGCPHSLGDIAISIDTVKKEAEEQSKTLTDHVAHLALHGFLHLLGYTHDNKDDTEIMERIELEVLAKLGIADPYNSDLRRG